MIERILRQDYQMRVALRGIEALRIARREKPDLVIPDMTMPGLDGLQVCQELRGNPALTDRVTFVVLRLEGYILILFSVTDMPVTSCCIPQ